MGRPKKSIARTITDPDLKPAPLTTEDQEFQSRQKRAENSTFQIKVFDDIHFPFTHYEVTGETNIPYSVEVRSLTEKINSCSCPDYQVNGLGSCKHIESTLNFIRSAGKRNFKSYATTGSNRTEIFLNQNSREACVRWPQNDEGLGAIRTLLAPYLTANQTHLTDPLMGAASIENALAEALQDVSSKIRLSSHLIQWKTDQLRIQDRESDRRQFMEDVAAGSDRSRCYPLNYFLIKRRGCSTSLSKAGLSWQTRWVWERRSRPLPPASSCVDSAAQRKSSWFRPPH